MNNTKEQKSPPTPQGEEEEKINGFKYSENQKPQGQRYDTGEKEETFQVPEPSEPISRERDPYGEILGAYNRILPELTRAEKITGSRSKTLAKRIAEDPARKDICWWERFFTRVRGFPWLMGSNPNNWKAAIDWLISEDGMQKVLEGAFRPRGVNDFTYEEKMALQKKYMYGEGLFDAQGMLAEWRALTGQNF